MCVVNEIHSAGAYGNMLTIEANVYAKLQKELPTSYNSQVNQRSKKRTYYKHQKCSGLVAYVKPSYAILGPFQQFM